MNTSTWRKTVDMVDDRWNNPYTHSNATERKVGPVCKFADESWGLKLEEEKKDRTFARAS